MRKVAVYYRVSTKDQEMDMQEHAINRWLQANDIKPANVKSFKDQAKSGKDLNRPAFKKMIRAALNGDFDTVVVYRIDRFSRSVQDAMETILKLGRSNVGFIAVDQPALNLGKDVPFRMALLAIFAELAEIERNTIVARVKAGLDAARKKGVRLGAPPKVTQVERAAIVQLRRQGASIRDIASQVDLSTATVVRVLKLAS